MLHEQQLIRNFSPFAFPHQLLLQRKRFGIGHAAQIPNHDDAGFDPGDTYGSFRIAVHNLTYALIAMP
jgi:hypothetical protein